VSEIVIQAMARCFWAANTFQDPPWLVESFGKPGGSF
jgi:hypothetical protein